jgi:hypothetical protein
MIKALQDPVLEDGIAFTSYFNGRLLSGEDLSRDQQGNREARRRLGQAMGVGVGFGLEVFETPGESTRTSPVVTVTPGVAVNRRGQALALRSQIDLRLVHAAADATSAATTAFRICDERRPGVYVAGEGVYVLTIGCAEGGQGRAPVSGLGNVAAACNVRAVLEGVQFRLVQPVIDPALLADHARLRNRMAGLALGFDERQAAHANPLAPMPPQYGLSDALRAVGAMSDDEVPLGLLHWNASEGITFVDMWSVRRRVTSTSADARWPWLMGDRVMSEAEATFLQFQECIEDLAGSGEDVSGIAAANRFEFLPSMGMLPLQIGTRRGFDPQRFFGSDVLSRDVAYTDGRQLRPLLHESFTHDPIAVAAQERVQLYLVYDNVQAAAGGQAVTPVLVFASGTLPYRGVARYGFARWEQGRFAPRVI